MYELTRKRGLILAGGGTKGAYQAGVLVGLHNAGIRFDVVCGISVGALNGALVVQGDSALLEELWREEIPNGRLFQRWPWYTVPFKSSFYSIERLRRMIEKYVDPEKIKSSPIKFYYGATCLQDGTLRYFDNTYDRVIDALLASCAIPLAFEPVEIDGRQYVDGGVLCNVPISKALEEGCDETIVVLMTPEDVDKVGPLTSRLGLAKRCLRLFTHSKDRRDLEHAQLLAERARTRFLL